MPNGRNPKELQKSDTGKRSAGPLLPWAMDEPVYCVGAFVGNLVGNFVEATPNWESSLRAEAFVGPSLRI